MEIVGAEEQTVETVEVVASGDDVPIPASSAAAGGVGLMEQHMMVTNPEGILVPTTEVCKQGVLIQQVAVDCVLF